MFSIVPFLLQYGNRECPSDMASINKDILHQFDLLWDHCYESQTGLLVHGYDASRTAIWADPVSGRSPNIWGRALGWYIIALINALESMQLDHESRKLLQGRLEKLIQGVAANADPTSGCWWQMMVHPGEPMNYLESSCTAMIVYSLYKCVRLGFVIDDIVVNNTTKTKTTYTGMASKAYNEMIRRFVIQNADGTLSINGTVAVCSLNSPATYQVR